jgi:uncharacterized membrane protein
MTYVLVQYIGPNPGLCPQVSELFADLSPMSKFTGASNMKTMKAGGMAIATAAAVLFATLSATTASADEAKVKCTGVNSCKGQSSCKSARNSCKGMNSCKGQGFVEMTKSECVAAKTKAKST